MMRVRSSGLARCYFSTKILKSHDIRNGFVDFFVRNHQHKFVRSSPVVPFCDPTVAFVNAGMNQPIFLGKTTPSSRRVANYQKCVRVGGKHNDLSVVGRDGYHHTFFEMLGNWSFGDYFKKDACEMALELLTGPFSIQKSLLYVTYFGGDEKLNLLADDECYNIWRELGFPKERIIPLGSTDNFWEMGLSGPCGPCTEIHISHSQNPHIEHSKEINSGRPDLTELWNIVFIEYNRNIDGSLKLLPEKHVDTGMGFERLTALLQNKSSNYDTDIFTPIFDEIHKICKVPEYKGMFPNSTEKHELDTAYRILADHARLITVCLSDGMLPELNQKLRRILRTSLLLAVNTFNREHLLNEILPVVVNILGPAYPEMPNKLNDVLEIVSHEEEIFKALRKDSAKDFAKILALNPNLDDLDLIESPGFLPAFKELQGLKDSFKNSTIPGQFLFKLYDTYGLSNEIIGKIAKAENLNYDVNAMLSEFARAKQKYKISLNATHEDDEKINDYVAKYALNILDTDDKYKYVYTFDPSLGKYKIPTLSTRIVGILQNGIVKNELLTTSDDTVCIITEKTNHYYKAGGQQCDRGEIVKKNNKNDITFDVLNVSYVNGCVIHIGKFSQFKAGDKFKIGDTVELTVDSKVRTFNTIHHTATHMLNAAVRSIFNKVTYQISSEVTSDYLKLELGIINQPLNKKDVTSIEDLIRKVINRGLEMNTKITNAAEVINDLQVTMIPGEIYPEDGLRLLTLEDHSLNFQSKELCCGTHVNNTLEIKNFCIINLKQTGRSRYAFTAVAGELAAKALGNATEISSVIKKLDRDLRNESSYDSTERDLQNIKKSILHQDILLPYVFRVNCIDEMNQLCKSAQEASRAILRNLVEIEMKNLLQEKTHQKHPYIIHFLKSTTCDKSVPLQKATRLCPDRPILIISCSEGILKARCCVPLDKVNKTFSAQKWLHEFAAAFNGEVAAPKGKDSNEVCNMKAKKVFTPIFEEQLETAIKRANQFASAHLKV